MKQFNRIIDVTITILVIACILMWAGRAWSAEVIDVPRLADAIKKAENSKTKPYGIMKDYCHAGAEAKCRKGCIQTIEKHMRRFKYSDVEGFLRQFADVYAPTKNATNDPKKLNRNWYKNTLHFYKSSV